MCHTSVKEIRDNISSPLRAYYFFIEFKISLRIFKYEKLISCRPNEADICKNLCYRMNCYIPVSEMLYVSFTPVTATSRRE